MVPRRLHLVRAASEPQEHEAPRAGLVVVRSPRLLRNVTRVMRASHVDVVTSAGLAAAASWLAKAPIDLVVCDHDILRSESAADADVFRQAMAAGKGSRLIVVSEALAPHELASFLEERLGDSIVAKLGELDNGDLLVTARKMLADDIFGIEKYLRWGSVTHSFSVTRSEEKENVLGHFEAFMAELRCQSRIAAQMLTVADEFITNAVYNAPVDEAGQPLYRRQSRTEKVVLAPHHAATLTFGSDGRFLAVGCRDPFGSLAPEIVCKGIARGLRRAGDQIRESAGGAGIGLYMVFQFVSHLVVNIEPDRSTEFIGVIDMTTGAQQRHQQARSLNIFIKRP